MAGSTSRRPIALVLALSVAGAVVAAVLGLLTFGAQATARPDAVPLAVSAPAQLRPVAERIAANGGDTVAWRVDTPEGARARLADKDVYGILELAPTSGGLGATVVLSGAVNPQGTQIAQQVLTGAAQAIGGEVRTVTVNPASIAGRTAPLAASALLWVAGLVAAAGFVLLAARAGLRVRPVHRLGLVAGVSVVGVAAVAGLLALWDSALPLGVDVLGFLLLTAVAFAAVQGALLRLLGIRAMAILGPLYLIAPAVAGQVPELLNPVYRALLWSWTPFRFAAEGLRSLVQGTGSAPDVRLGVIVLAALAVAGLAVLSLPSRRPADAPEPVLTATRPR
ncbi:ABC transporter permease [Actinokineospora sp.]|uniref:ABC transporter permease n=1 Tax=Actinokineospora sp. TaxID=1872133 RepID=UPI004037C47C